MKKQIVITDAGRSACGYNYETMDCTVRALAKLTASSYTDSHKFFKQHGRKNNSATHVRFLSRCGVTFNGFEFETLSRPHSTVKRYIAEHPKGKYMIVLSNHILTVIDGIIYDLHKLKHLVNRHVESVIIPRRPQKLLTNKSVSS